MQVYLEIQESRKMLHGYCSTFMQGLFFFKLIYFFHAKLHAALLLQRHKGDSPR